MFYVYNQWLEPFEPPAIDIFVEADNPAQADEIVSKLIDIDGERWYHADDDGFDEPFACEYSKSKETVNVPALLIIRRQAAPTTVN